MWIRPDQFHESVAQDLPAQEALVMAVTQKAPRGAVFGGTVTAPARRVELAWYQVSTDDRMLHRDNQRRMAKRMNARRIPELDSSHTSPATRPGPIADLIEEAARTPV